MSKWIVDRKPEHFEGWDGYVWKFEHDKLRRIVRWNNVEFGEPWMPIEPPEPYIKPKRWGVREFGKTGQWYIVEVTSPEHAWGFTIPTREAAERIAAIYEEVMP